MRCSGLHLLPPPPANKTGWPWTAKSQVCWEKEISEKWPRITIVTPSLNQGQFLEETIRSVLLQKYPNLEYIIIDGGSSDNSLEIIKKYSQWITYWTSEPDSGQSEAINKGFKMATGDILAWLNSDDLYKNGALKKIGKLFLTYPNVDIVYGGCINISANGAIINKSKIVPFNKYDLFIRNIISQPSTFFRKRLFNGVGPLNETLQLCFDVELWRKAATKYNFKYYNQYLSYFRFHSDSKSVSNSLKMKKESAEVTVDILKETKGSDVRLSQILRFRYLQLAVLCWRIKQPEEKVKYYISKADIGGDLFSNYYIQRIIFAFIDFTYFDLYKIDKNYIDVLQKNVIIFFNKYIRQYLPVFSKKYLSYLISHCYFMYSIKKCNYFFFFKGIIESPRYFLYFIIQVLGEMLQFLSPIFFKIVFFVHFDLHFMKINEKKNDNSTGANEDKSI